MPFIFIPVAALYWVAGGVVATTTAGVLYSRSRASVAEARGEARGEARAKARMVADQERVSALMEGWRQHRESVLAVCAAGYAAARACEGRLTGDRRDEIEAFAVGAARDCLPSQVRARLDGFVADNVSLVEAFALRGRLGPEMQRACDLMVLLAVRACGANSAAAARVLRDWAALTGSSGWGSMQDCNDAAAA